MEFPMGRPFSPDDEAAAAKTFRKLAKAFERPDTFGLSERFSILAVLSEEKAKVLKELDDVALFKSDTKASEILKWTELAKLPVGEAGDN
jgi:hypothetical protein